MTTSLAYVGFMRPRDLRDYLDDEGESPDGFEANGKLLSWAALDALEASGPRRPCQFVALGEWRREEPPAHYLNLGINPLWLETMTGWRKIDGRWVYPCPECGSQQGHLRSCSRR